MNCFIPNEYVKCLAWKAALLSNKGGGRLTHYCDVCRVDTQVNRKGFLFNSHSPHPIGDDSWSNSPLRNQLCFKHFCFLTIKQISEHWTKQFIQLIAWINQFAKKIGGKKKTKRVTGPLLESPSVLWVICNAACLMSLLVCPSLWVMTGTVWHLDRQAVRFWSKTF